MARRLTTLDDLCALAIARGGKCLSTEWATAHTRYRWRCGRGHEWQATWASVRHVRSWCPSCYSGLSHGERISRLALEAMLNIKLPTAHPTWLRISKRRVLELDGYNAEQQIAFEYHGKQHYEATTRFSHEDVSGIRERDTIKRRLCWEQGVTLVVVPTFRAYSDVEGTLRQIEMAVTAAGLKEAPGWRDRRPKDFEAVWDYVSQIPDVAHRIAEERRGRCLSMVMVKNRVYFEWQCEKGHCWRASLSRVNSEGTWCKRCATSAVANAVWAARRGSQP
jgi:hypothetical protein